jgi:hypothetical protein
VNSAFAVAQQVLGELGLDGEPPVPPNSEES